MCIGNVTNGRFFLAVCSFVALYFGFLALSTQHIYIVVLLQAFAKPNCIHSFKWNEQLLFIAVLEIVYQFREYNCGSSSLFVASPQNCCCFHFPSKHIIKDLFAFRHISEAKFSPKTAINDG